MKYISIGKILNFHGIKGEAKIGYSKSQAEFLSTLKSVLIKIDSTYETLTISSCKFNKNFAIMKFKEINSINDIIPYKGQLLYVEQTSLKEKLSDDEFLIEDLVGLDVYNQSDEKVGIVIGISNNGTNDYLNIKTKTKRTSLVPFIKELVPSVDIENKKVIISNLEGLIE
ncbi:16S rRNA processing protein RimM [bacterium]|nr:16S rRNA processing protein RimM [bacterium]